MARSTRNLTSITAQNRSLNAQGAPLSTRVSLSTKPVSGLRTPHTAGTRGTRLHPFSPHGSPPHPTAPHGSPRHPMAPYSSAKRRLSAPQPSGALCVVTQLRNWREKTAPAVFFKKRLKLGPEHLVLGLGCATAGCRVQDGAF